MTLPFEPSLEPFDDDVPCFNITVKVAVTGNDSDRAIQHINSVLMTAKRDEERAIWDWDIEDWELS